LILSIWLYPVVLFSVFLEGRKELRRSFGFFEELRLGMEQYDEKFSQILWPSIRKLGIHRFGYMKWLLGYSFRQWLCAVIGGSLIGIVLGPVAVFAAKLIQVFLRSHFVSVPIDTYRIGVVDPLDMTVRVGVGLLFVAWLIWVAFPSDVESKIAQHEELAFPIAQLHCNHSFDTQRLKSLEGLESMKEFFDQGPHQEWRLRSQGFLRQERLTWLPRSHPWVEWPLVHRLSIKKMREIAPDVVSSGVQ
jgi:hypothetical protein